MSARGRSSAALLALAVAVCAPIRVTAADVLGDRADWQEEALRTMGRLVDDEVVVGYVRDVAQRVGAAAAPIRVEVLRDSDAFAFALPNGAVYVSAGLLTRVRTESELAAILAREASLAVIPFSSAVPAGSGRVDFALVILGPESPLPYVYAPSTLRGLKEEVERAADLAAIERLIAAGYDPAAGAAIFDELAAQARSLKGRPPSTYAQPERLQSRARSLAAIARDRTPATHAPDRQFSVLRNFVLDTCDRFVRFGRPELAVAALGAPGRAEPFGSAGHRVLADAYRLRDEAGDDARARVAYEAALRFEPPDLRSHIGLAQLAARAGDVRAAAARYDDYLRAAASDAPERPMAAAERALLERTP